MDQGQASSNHWFEEPTDRLHEAVFSHINYLNERQSYRYELNLRSLRLYGNPDVLGLSIGSYTRKNTMPLLADDRIRLNVIQSLVDTAVELVAQNRPKPMFLTHGGNWSLQKKSKLLSQFCEAVFLKYNLYEEIQKSFRDSAIFGSGFIKVCRDGDGLCYDRVFPNEIKVNDAESRNGSPRSLHQVKEYSKDVLVGMFPKKKDDIFLARLVRERGESDIGYSADMLCTVVESWHLPSSEIEEDADGNAKTDGRHTICIDNTVLLDEPWEKEYFPFAKLDWSPPVLGFFGIGIAERQAPIQLEINRLLAKIQKCFHLLAHPTVVVERGSKIVKQHLTNDIGTIVEYTGTPPTVYTPQTVHPEVFNHLQWLITTAYQNEGISEMAAQSSKPVGLDSAVAQREYSDTQARRFVTMGQRLENAIMQVARLTMDVCKEIASDLGDFPILTKSDKGNSIDKIRWSEVDMDEDEFMMSIFPVSLLPSTPAGKLQMVNEMLQMGLFTPDQGQRLLDYPDISSEIDRINAPQKLTEKIIEEILEGKQVPQPDVYMDLQRGIKMMIDAYLQSRIDDAPEDVLQAMRDWIDNATQLVSPPPQPPMQPQVGIPVPNTVPGTAMPPLPPLTQQQPPMA